MNISKPTWFMLPVLMLSIFSFSQNTLKIQSNAVIDLNGGIVLTIQDLDLDNDGTLNPAAGAGRVIFKGAANSTIRGAGITNFDELEIAKTGNRTLMFQTNTNIRSGIWLNGGLINVNNRVITLLGSAALNGESETSRVTTSNNGYIEISMQLNGPREVNPGNLGAIISSTQNLGQTIIRRGHEPQTVESGRPSINRYFEITPQTNTALNATLRMQYVDAELNNHTENAIEFRLLDGGTWIKRNPNSRDATANYLELTGLNSFSRITLADVGATLPILFKSFTLACNNNQTVVTWVTSSEQNASHFEVQRSSDVSVWTSIATVAAAGNSTIDKTYSYTDTRPEGKFYRIKEVDFDGKTQFTAVVMADCKNNNDFKVWPNPVKEKLFVSLHANRPGRAILQVYNSNGKLVKQQFTSLMPGSNQVSMDMHTLSIGYYHVEVLWDKDTRKAITIFKN